MGVFKSAGVDTVLVIESDSEAGFQGELEINYCVRCKGSNRLLSSGHLSLKTRPRSKKMPITINQLIGEYQTNRKPALWEQPLRFFGAGDSLRQTLKISQIKAWEPTPKGLQHVPKIEFEFSPSFQSAVQGSINKISVPEKDVKQKLGWSLQMQDDKYFLIIEQSHFVRGSGWAPLLTAGYLQDSGEYNQQILITLDKSGHPTEILVREKFGSSPQKELFVAEGLTKVLQEAGFEDQKGGYCVVNIS